MYRLHSDGTVTRIYDGATIPPNLENRDYSAYLEWVAEGNEPELVPEPEVDPREVVRAARRAAYVNETDGLAFKVMRGEAEQSEWVAAVQAIRDRYPYPED